MDGFFVGSWRCLDQIFVGGCVGFWIFGIVFFLLQIAFSFGMTCVGCIYKMHLAQLKLEDVSKVHDKSCLARMKNII